MSHIGHVNSGGGAADFQPRPAAGRTREDAQRPGRGAEAPRRGPDRVELSGPSRARQAEGVRGELVVRVREQIERGTYETPERIDGAVDRLLGELDTTA